MIKKILVAGGAGFLGTHLCERLINKGEKVICLDNLITGYMTNIKNLLKNRNFQFIKHDITKKIYIKVDQIYNLACPASPIQYQVDPVRTIKSNIYGSINLLELAKKLNIKILQASTSEIYGDPKVRPQDESYWGNVNPIGIRSCYDEGKRAAETLFFDYYRQYGLKIKVIRIFNTYGPYMSKDDGRVVSNFIYKALLNKSLEIYGDGSQTRSFCYVDEMIDGLIKMMNSSDNIVGPINLGNPSEFTIQELAKKIISITKSNSKTVFRPIPLDDPVQRKPNISLAKKILDWEPIISLDEGLLLTIEYFKKLVNSKLNNI